MASNSNPQNFQDVQPQGPQAGASIGPTGVPSTPSVNPPNQLLPLLTGLAALGANLYGASSGKGDLGSDLANYSQKLGKQNQSAYDDAQTSAAGQQVANTYKDRIGKLAPQFQKTAQTLMGQGNDKQLDQFMRYAEAEPDRVTAKKLQIAALQDHADKAAESADNKDVAGVSKSLTGVQTALSKIKDSPNIGMAEKIQGFLQNAPDPSKVLDAGNFKLFAQEAGIKEKAAQDLAYADVQKYVASKQQGGVNIPIVGNVGASFPKDATGQPVSGQNLFSDYASSRVPPEQYAMHNARKDAQSVATNIKAELADKAGNHPAAMQDAKVLQQAVSALQGSDKNRQQAAMKALQVLSKKSY